METPRVGTPTECQGAAGSARRPRRLARRPLAVGVLLVLAAIMTEEAATAEAAQGSGDEKCHYYAGGEVYPGEASRVPVRDHSLHLSKAKISEPAPYWEGTAVINGEFKELKLTDFEGKYLVFFFYPLDFTFVCPTEIIAFSDRIEEFRAIGAEVVACSVDSQFTHLAWINTARKQGGLGSSQADRSPTGSDMNRFGKGRKRPEAEEGDAAAAAAAAAHKRAKAGAGMVNFCPQCGARVEASFKFCASCGVRLPTEEEGMQITPTSSMKGLSQEDQDHLPRSPAKKKAEILPDKGNASSAIKWSWSPSVSPTKSPKAKAKPSYRSPRKDRSATVRPLPEGEILTDMNNKQWKLGKLLSEGDYGLMYEAMCASEACCSQRRYTLKLDCKDGRLFNEQNFMQRAAKKATVEKWKKQHSVPLLGIPNCVGFGLHNSNYRFLVFSYLGRSLQSILDDCANKMTEKAALQLAIRLVDVLEFLHENEYTHGDITAQHIYVNPADLAAITLADYCFAFRYSPGGKHVSECEGSRTPHEGNIEFISIDSHKGAAPSRRSDLESLGYCLVKWLCRCLPWSEDLDYPCVVMQKKERYKADVIKSPRLSFDWKSNSEALKSYLLQVMSLEYEEKPDYEELRTVLTRPLELMRTSAYDSVDLKVAP